MEEKDLINYIVITSSAVVFLVAIVLVDMFLILRKRRQLAQKEKELSQRKIDDIMRKNEVESVNILLRGKNTERQRISRELHDRLGGILFTANLYQSNLEKKIPSPNTDQKEGFTKMKRLLKEAVDEVRRISHDLSRGSQANFSYAAVMPPLLEAIQESTGLNISFSADEAVSKQSEEIQRELHALTQEMLSNTLKHADAKRVKIEVELDNEFILRYSDDGQGFDVEKPHKGIGLKNIEDRVEKLKGNLSLESHPKTGTSYLITIPVNQ